MIDAHYLALRVHERWDWARYVRLCRFLCFTTGELASFVGMPHRWVALFEASNKLPIHSGSMAIALHLCNIEHYVMADYADTIDTSLKTLPLDALPGDT